MFLTIFDHLQLRVFRMTAADEGALGTIQFRPDNTKIRKTLRIYYKFIPCLHVAERDLRCESTVTFRRSKGCKTSTIYTGFVEKYPINGI